MKLLIAITMMVFTSTSAFADCAAKSAGDCKDQVSCEKLNVGGKKLVEWKVMSAPQTAQCVSLTADVAATDCSSIYSGSGAKGTQDTAPGKQAGGAVSR